MKTRYEIEPGDLFMCLKDYVMDDDCIEFTDGKQYKSERVNCITDNEGDAEHQMNCEEDFFEYFRLLEKANGCTHSYATVISQEHGYAKCLLCGKLLNFS